MPETSETNGHDEAAPKNDQKPHKVDEKVQEDAAKERAENEGYD